MDNKLLLISAWSLILLCWIILMGMRNDIDDVKRDISDIKQSLISTE